MDRPFSAAAMRNAWNRTCSGYQERRQLPPASIHYGPFAPDEDELQLLGALAGLRVLEVGCGGGQSSIAFAQRGATVTALDISDHHLDFARELATSAKVAVDFVHGAAEDLGNFEDGAWDLLFSTYTLQYVVDIERCLGEFRRVLPTGGRLVFSLNHPLWECFFDEEEGETAVYPVRSYFDNRALRWRFVDTGIAMRTTHYTVAQWIDLLAAASFQLLRIVEPQPPAELADDLWPLDGPLAPLRHLPHAIIFVAQAL